MAAQRRSAAQKVHQWRSEGARGEACSLPPRKRRRNIYVDMHQHDHRYNAHINPNASSSNAFPDQRARIRNSSRANTDSMMQIFPKSFLGLLSLQLVLQYAWASACSAPHPRKTCVIPSSYNASNGTADDSTAVASAFASCSSNAAIVFSPGVDYNVFQPIKATNLTNVSYSHRMGS